MYFRQRSIFVCINTHGGGAHESDLLQLSRPAFAIPLKQGSPRSVRFVYVLGVEQFQRFWFSVLAVPLGRVKIFCVSIQFNREGRFRFEKRFLKNGSNGSASSFRVFRFLEKRLRRFQFPSAGPKRLNLKVGT